MSMTVRDEARELQFDGVLLAEATSKAPGKERWIELQLYRTAEGNYVLSRVGRSERDGETDRFHAQVSESPQGVIESLTLIDEDSVRYLTRVARTLLDRASEHDSPLNEAYHTGQIR